jgi:hypothetical protein
MKTMLKKLWIELSNHNRYKLLATITAITLLFFFNGCQIKVASINDPTKKITIPELQSEIDTFNNRVEDRIADVNEQLMFRDFLWNSALTVATSGTFNWLNFLTSAGTLFGAGAFADNVRYRISTKKKKE